MAKYKIELIVESDNDYFDGNQIEGTLRFKE